VRLVERRDEDTLYVAIGARNRRRLVLRLRLTCMPLRNRRRRGRWLAQWRSGHASISNLLLLLLLYGELRLLLEMELSKLDLLLLPSMMCQLLLLLPYMLVSGHGSLLMVLWHLLTLLLWRYHCTLWRTVLLYLIVVYLGASKGLGTM
jgi:hypothetical protein